MAKMAKKRNKMAKMAKKRNKMANLAKKRNKMANLINESYRIPCDKAAHVCEGPLSELPCHHNKHNYINNCYEATK